MTIKDVRVKMIGRRIVARWFVGKKFVLRVRQAWRRKMITRRYLNKWLS